MGFKTYWSRFDDTTDMGQLGRNLRTLMDDADELHFNLDGMAGSVDEAIAWGREGIGHGNVTNWELAQIADNADWLGKTTFYRNGEVVSTGAIPQ